MSVHQLDEFRLRRSIEERFVRLAVPHMPMGGGVLVCVPPHGRALLLATRWDDDAHRMKRLGCRVVQVESASEAQAEYDACREGQ